MNFLLTTQKIDCWYPASVRVMITNNLCLDQRKGKYHHFFYQKNASFSPITESYILHVFVNVMVNSDQTAAARAVWPGYNIC